MEPTPLPSSSIVNMECNSRWRRRRGWWLKYVKPRAANQPIGNPLGPARHRLRHVVVRLRVATSTIGSPLPCLPLLLSLFQTSSNDPTGSYGEELSLVV